MSETQLTLSELIRRLKTGTAEPLPDGPVEWSEHIRRVSNVGAIAEVTEEQYWYWLEVLPPKWMRDSHFCFAEGEEPYRLFWLDHATRRYFVRPTSWDETLQFCRLARISPPS